MTKAKLKAVDCIFNTERMDELVQSEIDYRNDVKRQVVDLILQKYEFGEGCAKRGAIQQFAYSSMGFHGEAGCIFQRFINKTLTEVGCRMSFRSKVKVFYGIRLKEVSSSNL